MFADLFERWFPHALIAGVVIACLIGVTLVAML
jgi:hypothetical protein